MSHPVFTIILDTYYRPALLKQAVEALFRQTYPHLEIILVNNAATPETVDYLHEAAARDGRVKLIHFRENQYSPEDPLQMVHTCYNAGLRAATGDYVWYQSDDDWIANDYAEKMVRLFQGNAECITAAGLPVAVNAEGKVMEAGKRKTNLRRRYMPGHEVALDYLRGGNMFSAPGSIFTIRRDVLVTAGGFHRALEASHLLGIVPFGVTGFDETALLFWRRHEGQLNKQLIASGWVGINYTLGLLRDWQIERRWQVFGACIAKEVVTKVQHRAESSAATWFVINLFQLRLRASLRIARKCYRLPGFWLALLVAFWQRRSEPFLPLRRFSRLFGRVILRFLFQYLPPAEALPVWLQSLRERVTR